MKILVVQLARLGDIYMSWPSVRALRRKYADAEISVLARPRFLGAWEGCDAKLKVIPFDVKTYLAPLVSNQPDVQKSFSIVSEWVDKLAEENFDKIINLSFSPLSSYITHALTSTNTQVAGYSRFEDGFLSIPDDMSAYFYAQVGPGRPNRFHLAEIFATLAESDLVDDDWRAPEYIQTAEKRKGIVVHVGASEAKKSLRPAKWASIIQQLIRKCDRDVTIIGSSAETKIAEVIMSSVSGDRLIDCVGKTNLQEMAALVAGSELLIGCDSAPIHVASLTQTPCLNVSLPTVNFWETGPRAKGSAVLRIESEDELASDHLAEVARQLITGFPTDISVIKVKDGTPSYNALTPKSADYQWRLVQAMYQGGHFPRSTHLDFENALLQLSEVNSLVLEQLQFLSGGGDLAKVASILNTAEEIINTIGGLSDDIAPLIRWYQTEKLRIGPDDHTAVLEKTHAIHELLGAAIATLANVQTIQVITSTGT